MAITSPEAKARKAEYMKAYRAAKREELREYNRAWLEQNKAANAEKAKVRNARYYAKHQERIAEERREKYAQMGAEARRRRAGYVPKPRKVMSAEERKAKRREAERRYREQNPAAAAERLAARRARLIHATVAWADRKQIKAIYEMANELGRLSGVPMDVDHIVPLRGPNVCGLHVQNNLRVAPAEYNQRKGNRHAA